MAREGSAGVVISLCDRTGVMVEPWLEAGYDCWIVDLQHPRGVTTGGRLTRVGANILELHPYHRWLPQNRRVAFACAFPECTHFAYSGQRWRRENGPMATAEGFRLFAGCWDLLRFYDRERGAAWLLENPKGIVWSWCKPDHAFHPWQYGDNESKETGLWTGGGLVIPAPSVTLRPLDAKQSVWQMAPSAERGDLRSVTPPGFARAVFEANHRPVVAEAAS